MGTYADIMLGGRWHDGSGTVTFSFATKMAGYFPLVDYDGKAGDDAIRIGTGVVDELVPLNATIVMNGAQQGTSVRAINAWNEIANINMVSVGAGGSGSVTPVTGDSTLIGGLGGATGYGELVLVRGDNSPNPNVDISSVFPNGINFFGATYKDLFVNLNGSISFGSAVGAYTPTEEVPASGIEPARLNLSTKQNVFCHRKVWGG